MAWAAFDSGTFNSTVDNTRRNLDVDLGGSQNGPFDTDAIIILEIDVNAVAMGDQIGLWLLSETTSTGRVEQLASLANVQTDGKVRTSPFLVHDGWVFQFVQPAGSSRSFTWAVWADTL